MKKNTNMKILEFINDGLMYLPSLFLDLYYLLTSLLHKHFLYIFKHSEPALYALVKKAEELKGNNEFTASAEIWKSLGKYEKAAAVSFSGALHYYYPFLGRKAAWEDFAFLFSDALKYYTICKNFFAAKNISKHYLRFLMKENVRIGRLFYYIEEGIKRKYLFSEILTEFCEENWDAIIKKEFNWKLDFAYDLLFHGGEYRYAKMLIQNLENKYAHIYDKNNSNFNYKYLISLCGRKFEVDNYEYSFTNINKRYLKKASTTE